MSDMAWHWVGGTLRNGSPVPEDGETLVHDGPVTMCRSGLHASRRIIDALKFAPGGTVCRVEVAGIVEEQDDKLVCRERTILWRVDAEDLLRDFARRCALDVIDLWDAPEVVREYLETGDESLREGAWYAARGTGRSDAARAAARRAARDAVWGFAWLAAGEAAWYAARGAASDAARDRQNRRLTAMVSAARS